MAIVATDDKHYKAIADAIRESCVYGLISSDETFKPEQMGQAVRTVWEDGYTEGGKDVAYSYQVGYEEGYAEGQNDGWDNGYTEGKQTLYDEFWDAFQNYGKRTNYRNGIGGIGWNDNNFRPKYELKMKNAYQAFGQTGIVDLATTLEKAGVTMSNTAIQNGQYMFWTTSYLKRIPTLRVSDGSTSATAYGMFSECPALETIDKIILGKQIATSFWNSTFNGCKALANVVFEGEPIRFSISFKDSPLTKESITSVINALSTEATGQTATFKKTAKEAAFTQEEWEALIATRSNWTFSLV